MILASSVHVWPRFEIIRMVFDDNTNLLRRNHDATGYSQSDMQVEHALNDQTTQ